MARKKACETENAVFATKLRDLMSESATTQQELADALSVKRQTISLYTTGQSKPNVEQLVVIANFFNVSADWMLGLTADRKRTPSAADDLGLSEKAIRNLMVYRLSPDQKSLKTLNLLLESVGFSGFLAFVSRYISECNKKDPPIETWVKPDLETYRYILEKNGFVVTTHSEAARNCYETALEELKKTLDKIVEQTGGEHNGQHP